MKDFFKFMFASMLGFFLTFIIVFFLFFAFLMAMLSFTKSEDVVINEKTILHLKLDYPIEDRSSKDPWSFNYDFTSLKSDPGLNEIIKNIKKAKKDDRVKGIYLDLSDVPSGLATISEIRNSLDDFKEFGKFIFAYGEMLSQKAYYLATVADKVFLTPEGMLEFRGYRGEVIFLKGLLEKLEIEPQIIRHGKYKSAIEPLILDKMSEANKEQTLTFIQSMWDNTIKEISEARNIEVSALNDIANKLDASRTINAHELNLIDSVLYYDQFLTFMADKIDKELIAEENLISINNYSKARIKDNKKKRSRNKIAVVYASGSISQGEGNDNSIGSDRIARTLRNARLDESIKAVVFRVNSPGGDGLASDIILREVSLIKEEKPIVVSMGDLAASGGYYVACGANKIIANPNTITGSIGVFGIIPNFQMFFKNKLGITFDEVMTNENSDFMNVTKPMSEYQYELIQKEVDNFYSAFINHVVKGRNMTYEQVDEIGQGRVWSGIDALNLGLVDELGGLDDAIETAVELADLDDYRIVELPEQKDPFEKIITDLMNETKYNFVKKELGTNYQYLKYLKEVSEYNGIQARLPFEIYLN
ncbi:MAG: signal peptide peptidase SppA [Bacteroidales bacterium]|nr:signal peptide peptidase SppA [Bacteroidales bacterium]